MAGLNVTFFEKHATNILFIGLLLMIVSPILLTLPTFSSYFDFSKTGQIGDTIGGITAPVVNFLGAVLVYISFKSQQRANEQQWSVIQLDNKIKNWNKMLDKLENLSLDLFKKNVEGDSEFYNFVERLSDYVFITNNSDISSYYTSKNLFRIKINLFLNTYSILHEKVTTSDSHNEIKANYYYELFLLVLDHSEDFYNLRSTLKVFFENEENYPKAPSILKSDLKKTLKKIDEFIETFDYCSKVIQQEQDSYYQASS